MSWKITTDRGQQIWKYNPTSTTSSSSSIPPPSTTNSNSSDLPYRTQHLKNFTPFPHSLPLSPSISSTHSLPSFPPSSLSSTAQSSALKAIHFYQHLQMSDGHWGGDYGGPMFLMPGMIIVMYITGVEIEEEKKKEMRKYLLNHQLKDGGWGIHIENGSTIFGTVLSYISLRLLGLPASHSSLLLAHSFLHQHGGAIGIPSWGKFWLCVLNLMPWEGVNSLFPELWLMPEILPFHPSRWWCHCRMVYLPMAYIYAVKLQAKENELIRDIRKEIYVQDYNKIDFTSHRNNVSSLDLYTPHSSVLRLLNLFTNTYERYGSLLSFTSSLRSRAASFLLSYINAEDEQTKYVDIGPVNKFINMLAIWSAYGKESQQFKAHVERVDDYLWVAEDGMKVQGYNGSQLWDTTFAVQAIVETGLSSLFSETLKKAYEYIDLSQVNEDVKNRKETYRHISKGGWPFSTKDHGWPISDCTAEGIKASLLLNSLSIPLSLTPTITSSRLADAINVILSFQNLDGGWATYENTRGSSSLELINASEVFGNIMIDYSYVECSSACIQSLCKYREAEKECGGRREEVEESIRRGIDYIKKIQREDGSWYGSWAVCFTYGTWFGCEALVASGSVLSSSPPLQRAVQFLLSIQLPDGGWGESYLSCVEKKYVPHKQSQVINTAWAILGLIAAGVTVHCRQWNAVERGVKLLVERQRENGDWDQEAISGVFNGNCMISYTNYRNIFPIWAIGKYMQVCKKQLEEEGSAREANSRGRDGQE